MAQAAIAQKEEKQQITIPDYLIYEIIDGKPIYYRGYKEVLNKTKKLEDIIGCSSLQFVIINYLVRLLAKFVDDVQYMIATNGVGIHIDKNNNLATDISLFDWSVLTPDKISKKYADVPPFLTIEVDTDAEISREENGMTYPDYVHIKTQKLLDFGVEKVIWIFTTSHRVMIAKKGTDWLTKDWNQEIEVMENISFNIGKYLKEKGIDA